MDRETKEKIIELNKRLGLRTEFIEDEEVLGYSIGRTIYINIGIEQDYEKTNKHELLHYYEETEEFKKIKEQVLEENKENLEEIRREYELRYYGLYSEEEIKAGVLENEIVIDMLIENSVIEYNRGLEIGEILLGEIERGLEEKRYLTISLSNNIRNMNLSKWEKIFVQNYYDGKERKLPPKEGRKEKIKEEIEKSLEELYSMTEEDFKIDPHSPGIIREYESEIKALQHRGEDASFFEQNKEKALEELSERFSKQLWEEYKHIVDFIKGEEYEPAFKYLMLKETLTKTYKKEKTKEKENTLVDKRELKKSISGHMVLNKTTLDIIYQKVEDGKNFANIYFAALEVFNRTISEKNEIAIEGIETFDKGKWLKFEGKRTNEEKYLENAEKLASLVQDTPWCTKTVASSQLAEGDFFVFVDNEGKPHIAVKTKGQEIDEVRGIKNGNAQELEEEYRDVALSFLEENKEIENGKEWLEKEEWNKRLIEYNKKIKDGSFRKEDVEGLVQDLFHHDYKRNRENSNKNELMKNLSNIKGLLAEYYGIDEKELYCGDIDFSEKTDVTVCPYKVILGNVKFDNSQITNLGGLQIIAGNANFYRSQIKDLGDLQIIGGNANFSESDIKSIGNLREIGGDAYFYYSEIESLRNLQEIGGDVDFEHSLITSLGDLQKVGGNANFGISYLMDLGNLKEIGGRAQFCYSSITSLGDLQKIGGDADFSDSQITNLENLISIGGNADFSNSQITNFGNLQNIEGNAIFKDSQITTLGNLQRIGGNADFKYSQIIDLGKLRTIGGDANFEDSIITDLGNLESIERDVNFENSQVKKLGKLEKVGRDANFRCAKIISLENLKNIGRDASFEYSQIIDLGELRIIGGNANFENSQVTELGNLQEIGENADFEYSHIIDLGELRTIGGDVSFEYSQIKKLGKLQIIGGNANFGGYSQVVELENLQEIGGNANFGFSIVKDLGALRIIRGDASFEHSELTTLKNLQEIGGNANFNYSEITSLGNLQNIGKNASFRETRIVSLENLQKIGGDADFDFSAIRDLGELRIIGGKANLEEIEITSLGKLQSVEGKEEWDNKSEVCKKIQKTVAREKLLEEKSKKEMEEILKIVERQRTGEFLTFLDEISEITQEQNNKGKPDSKMG